MRPTAASPPAETGADATGEASLRSIKSQRIERYREISRTAADYLSGRAALQVERDRRRVRQTAGMHRTRRSMDSPPMMAKWGNQQQIDRLVASPA